jgi:mannosyltransferase OCH1-like enzyme
MIPKIIWQTEEAEFENLLPFQKNIIGTWKNLNPDWEHRYADSKQREQDVKDYNDTLYKVYQISSGINRADIWRMVVTYTHGGFYADMDSICTIPLNDIISQYYRDEDMISSSKGFQTNHESINNSNFAATKNSKTMKSILYEMIVRCEKILESESRLPSNIPGFPVHGCFSKNAIKNEYGVCYIDNYFSHSKDYKGKFDIDYKIVYNGKLTSYSEFVKESNLLIY